ncbi:MAG: IS701 family transposase [Thermomicrobiales bacterium]
MTSEAEMVAWAPDLDAVQARIGGRFRRSEQRARAARYLRGLPDRVERKNGWQLAVHLGEAGPHGVQRLLNGADRDADAVRDDLRSCVVERLGAPDGVLIVDETVFPKKGAKSVGVQRQYSGTAGRIENCQISVFLAYASVHGHAFADRALYLPEVWAQDRARREEAGVPEETGFATKPRLARQMLERAFAARVPAAWVTADEIHGDATELRRWSETHGRPHVLAVSRAHPIRRDGVQARADRVVAALPPHAWATCSAGGGGRGERRFDRAWIRLPVGDDPGTAHRLLARRSPRDPAEPAYHRACGPVDTAVAEPIRAAGMRWAVEVGFEDAKGVVGLDHHEVRNRTPWHRHVTLALLAHAHLEVTRRAATNQAHQKGGSAT